MSIHQQHGKPRHLPLHVQARRHRHRLGQSAARWTARRKLHIGDCRRREEVRLMPRIAAATLIRHCGADGPLRARNSRRRSSPRRTTGRTAIAGPIPAYYLFNSARELTDMQVDNRYGQSGKGEDAFQIKSPYPFKDSWEHYQAWLQKANGGTKHTLATLPDWDGMWDAGPTWLDSRRIQASTIAAALTSQYREYYVQQVKAESEGRHWWAASFCLPDGYLRGLTRAEQFVVRPTQVLMLSDMLIATQVRWVFTDGGHRPPEEAVPAVAGRVDRILGRQCAGRPYESDPSVECDALVVRVERSADVRRTLRAGGRRDSQPRSRSTIPWRSLHRCMRR